MKMGQEQQESSSQGNQAGPQDIYVDRSNKEVDLNLFGLNLAKLDTTSKYFIGFVLIALIFYSVIYGLKKIGEMNQKNKKEKKNKKTKTK